MHYLQNNSQQNSSHPLIDTNETTLSDDGRGWLTKATNGVLSVGVGAVTHGWGGLKWALESTASVGTTVFNAGSDGVSQLKKKVTKDKNEWTEGIMAFITIVIMKPESDLTQDQIQWTFISFFY